MSNVPFETTQPHVIGGRPTLPADLDELAARGIDSVLGPESPDVVSAKPTARGIEIRELSDGAKADLANIINKACQLWFEHFIDERWKSYKANVATWIRERTTRILDERDAKRDAALKKLVETMIREDPTIAEIRNVAHNAGLRAVAAEALSSNAAHVANDATRALRVLLAPDQETRAGLKKRFGDGWLALVDKSYQEIR